MKDKDKKHEQLIKELASLRKRIAELEAMGRKRNQVEEALRQSEEKYRTILENIEEGYYEVDLAGNFTFVNDSMCRIQGYPRDELMGMNNRDYMDKDFAKKVYKIFNTVFRTGKSAKLHDWQIIRKDGSKADIEASVTLRRDTSGNPTGFRGIVRDISERKRAEEVLREERDKAQQYLDIAEVILVALNKKGKITLINKKGNQILGYKEGELLGKDWFTTCVPSHIRKKIKNGFQKLMAGERTLTEFYENPALTKSGTERIMAWHNTLLKDAQGNPIGTLSSGEDITERKQVEKKLRGSRHMLQTVLDSIPSAVFWKDRNSIYLGGNRAWLEAAGLKSSEEVAGKSDYDLPWEKEEADSFRKDDRRVMKSGIPESGIIEPYLRADGTHAWAMTNKVPLRDTEGNVIGILGTFEDITERKQAEDKIRESKQLLEKTFVSLRDAIFIIDANTVKIVDCNPAASEIFGYGRDEILNQTVDFLHVDQKALEEFRRHLYAAIEKQGFLSRLEFKMKRKDGTIFPTEHSVTPLEDEQGNRIGWVSVVHDITERKQAEGELRESETRFRTLFETIPDTVLVHDDKGKILHINEISAQRLEYSAKDLIGRNLREIVTPENAVSIADHVRETHKVGWSRFETTYVSRSGWKIMAEVNEHPIMFGKEKAILSVARDITERKRAEEALQASEKRFRQFFENEPTYCYMISPAGIIIDVNNAALSTLGYTKKELVDKPLKTIYAPECLPKMEQLLAQWQKTGKLSGEEMVIITKKGERRMVLLSSDTIKDANGKVLYSISVQNDITERKQAEEALQESEEQYRDLVENINDIIYATDANGIVTYIAPTIEPISGYTTSEIIDRPFFDFVYKEDIPSMQDNFQKDISDHAEPREYRMVTKSGDVRWVRTSSQPFLQGKRVVGLRGVLTDITERKKTEEALKKNQALLEESQQLAHIGSWDLDVKTHNLIWSDEVFRIFGLRPQEFQPTFEEFIKRLHPDDQGILPGHYRETLETKTFRTFNYRITRPNGTVRWIQSTGVVHSDGAGTPARIVGTLQDITERKEAEEALQLSYDQLRDTLISTVDALASTVEMKDQYIAGHQPRVTQLACAIAKEMGLTEEQIEGIHMAGSIHDIGKIMVPAEILNKPGPLTDIQYEMVKMHPRAGYDILKGIEFPWPVAQIVLQHHEMMDGSGYPDGLSGEEIMLEARILAVANVIESMTSHRPYRPAFNLQEALEKISKNKGNLYDPAVVDVCLELFTEKGFVFDSTKK